MPNPNQYIKDIIGTGIEFYDYRKLDKQLWKNYKNDASFIVNSEVFNNELQCMLKDLMKKAALETSNFDQVMHIRSMFVALETFKQRLQNIEDPDTSAKKHEEPHSAI